MNTIVKGVGLVVVAPDSRILLLRELANKPHYGKTPGMVSIPFEGVEDGETPDQSIKRLIHEEIGVPIEDTPKFFKEFLIKLSETHSVQLYVYQVTVLESFDAQPNDTDIVHFGWMSPTDILSLAPQKRRIEVEPVMRSYLCA